MRPVINHTSLVLFEFLEWSIKNIFRFIRRKINEARRAL